MNSRVLIIGLVVTSRVYTFDQGTVSEVVWLQTNLLHFRQKLPSLIHPTASHTDVDHGIKSDIVGLLVGHRLRVVPAWVRRGSLDDIKHPEGLLK